MPKPPDGAFDEKAHGFPGPCIEHSPQALAQSRGDEDRVGTCCTGCRPWLVPLPLDLERKSSLEDRPAVIPDFDGHRTPCPVAMRLHGVPRHVRERAGCLFLDGFNGGEFEPLLVGGDFVFVAHVEIVAWHIHQAVLVGVSQKLATREAEGQSIASLISGAFCARETLELPPVTQNDYFPQL